MASDSAEKLSAPGREPKGRSESSAHSLAPRPTVAQNAAKTDPRPKLQIDPATTESSTTMLHSCKVGSDMVDMESAVSPEFYNFQQDGHQNLRAIMRVSLSEGSGASKLVGF
jgi:hypothetical protein